MTRNEHTMSDVTTVSTQAIYRNRWMTLREDKIQRADGSSGIYSVVDKPDFALIIPLDRGGFHLIEQHRYPVNRRFWEFPQGTPSAARGTVPIDLAREELAEETGLQAGRLVQLGHLYPAYGMSSQGCDVFLATDLTPGSPHPEPEEHGIRQRWVAHEAFEEMIRTGTIVDAATIAAYALLLLEKDLLNG
jgi:8-oxo-dGTP pyrophosphatase MutT (NUDIX family)